MLQRCALEKRYRVSILSGDAHVGGVGEIYSARRPRLDKVDDELFMYQIISSAVMNSPPPQGVVSALTRTNFSRRIDGNTRSKMQKAFGLSNRPTKKLLDRRNWCEITADEDSSLRFSLRAEELVPGEDTRYDFVAPRFPMPKGV